MTTAAAWEDHEPGLDLAFARVPREGSWRINDISGKVPAFVRGTLFMNGPARFARGRARCRHWLDGDGMLCALRIANDEVSLTTRFVRSRKYSEEETLGRPLFRTFGTAFPDDRLHRGVSLESPVNVSVFPFNGRLLAFGEQGLPWDIDPGSLETHGPFTFSGALNDVSPFSAHPKIDSCTGELFNFGVSFVADRPALHVYRFGADASLMYRHRVPLPYACSIHDFSLGARYLVFHISPYVVDLARLIDEGTSLMDALSWEPDRGSRVWILDRRDGRLLLDIEVPARYALHHAGCVETSGCVTLDLLELAEPVYAQYVIEKMFTTIGPGRAVRLHVDLEHGALIDRRETGYSKAPDFPTTDAAAPGARYSRLWMLGMSRMGRHGRKFFDELVAVDWSAPSRASVYRAPSGWWLAGEPVFVPDPRDAVGGAVLCPMLDVDGDRTIFCVFDARQIEAGPIARLATSPALHLLFHGVFAAHISDHA